MSYIDLNDLGSFASINALWAAHPEGGQEGDYCTIDGVKYRWDKYDRMWVADPNFGPTPARSVTTFDGDVNMQNNLTVAGYIRAKGIKQPCLGLYLSEPALKAKWPDPEVGMWALVGEKFPATVYVCETNGEWTETQATGGPDDVDLSNYVTVSEHESDIAALVPKSDIADNLTTDDATKVLSARQGKKINDKISIQTTLTSAGLSQGAYATNMAIGEPISPTINTSVQTYGCMLLPVSAGDTVTIATKGGSGARAYALTDSNYIALVVANSNVTTISNPVTLDVEQDGYLFVNCENTAFENFSIIHRASVIAKIEDDIENIDREVESLGQSLFGQYSYNNDYLSSGVYRTNVSIGATISTIINNVAGYGCMLLPVSAGDAVTISTKGADGGRAYALTDAEYRALVIADKNLDTTSSPVTLNVEQDGYLFVNCAEEVYDDFSVHHKYSRLSEMEENIERVPGEAATNVLNVLSDGNGKSQNFAIYNGHNCYISDLWIYDDGHSADTDIQRNVHTSSVGVFKDPIVSKVARYSGMATRRWKQYFNQEEGVGIGSAIGTLLSLQQQDSGEMLPLQMKATFYNPNSFPIKVTLGLALSLSVGGYAYPTASKVTVPAEGSATAYFSYIFPDDSNLTWANVTKMMGYTTTDEVEDVAESDPVWLEMGDVDLWFEDPKHRVNRPFINPSLIENGITESQLTSSLQDKINATVNNTIDRNLRVSCAGSSVTWGDGFLQGSMMKFLIPMLQSQYANVIPYDRPTIAGSSSTLSGDSWRQLYGGYATKLEGANASLEFDIEGDELTICQAIERSNDNASVIDVYINGSLYGSFSNYNTDPIGHTTKTFTAEAGQKEFILEMPFTYNHVVTVNGVAVTANINTQGQGGTIPTGHWGMICRDVKDVNGETKVVHTLFAKEGQAAGTEISVSFDYGHEILYEKTTIGKDGNGTLESAFGRGYTAFDPAHPQDGTFESGLDFRSTDERAMVSYRFHESAVRHVKLVVKELDSRATDSEGTPYFIFNFATNRIMWFQNAGIGGYRSSYFISNNDRHKLKTWKEIADFQPDYVMYESAPNDDWSTAGYKLYSTYDNLTLSQLRKLRTLPNKEISYDSANGVYCYKRYAGIITAITKNTVTFEVNSEHVIVTAPEEGDVVQVGTYHSNNKEVVVRLVAAYDSSTHTITFDRPINKRDFIYDSLDDFVGLEIQVRDLGSYGRDTTTLCNLLKTHCDDVKIGLVCNPAPNLHCRNIDVYKPYLDKLANKIGGFYVDLSNVYEWQNSIPRDREETVSASSLETDPLTGYKTLVVDSLAALTDRHNWSVEVDGVNVYGTDAFVDTRGYGVSQSESGSSLNSTQVTGGGSEGNLKPRLIFVKNAPTTGTITLRYSSDSWSSDSTHLKNDFGRGLYAIGYKAAIMSNVAEGDNSSSGGGGDIMVVRFRQEEGDTFSCDTSIADIYAAVSAGTEVVGLVYESTSQTWASLRVSVASSTLCVFDMQYSGVYTNLIGSIVNGTDVWRSDQCLNLVTDDQMARWNNKQDALVSGTNIKTINNQSLLGSGNITIQGGGGSAVQSDWNQSDSTADDYIKNKPSLADVATSGSYNDLSNKPTIPDAQIQADWNQTTSTAKDYIKNKPTIPVVPTNVSAFTNDAGYLTQHQNIKTVNNTSLVGSGNMNLAEPVGVIAVAGATPTQTLSPNTFYKFTDAVTSLTLTLGSEVSGITNIYAFRFTAGQDNPTITLPQGVQIADAPTIATGDYVEFSIVNNKAIAKLWSAS